VKVRVSLTPDEIFLLLHSITIAREDGSIYGDNFDDKTINQKLDKIVAKLNGLADDRVHPKGPPYMSDERLQRLERASAETATITHLVSLLMTLDQVGILECQQNLQTKAEIAKTPYPSDCYWMVPGTIDPKED
jgi:hypothetical protein